MEEKTCEKCKYYLPHYVKKNASLHLVGGHCTYSDVKGKTGRKMQLHGNCKKWESPEQRKGANKEVILETLQKMEKRLSEIALILKDEN